MARGEEREGEREGAGAMHRQTVGWVEGGRSIHCKANTHTGGLLPVGVRAQSSAMECAAMDRACRAQAEGPSRFDARRKSTHASHLPQVLHAQDLSPQVSLPATPTFEVSEKSEKE